MALGCQQDGDLGIDLHPFERSYHQHAYHTSTNTSACDCTQGSGKSLVSNLILYLLTLQLLAKWLCVSKNHCGTTTAKMHSFVQDCSPVERSVSGFSRPWLLVHQ